MDAKRLRLLHKIMKTTHMYKLLLGFLIYFFITTVLIWLVDPVINSFSDSLWYCFAACTTVGFGDLVVTSEVGRVLTILLTVYGLLIVAFIPGVIVSYFTEFNKIKSRESVVKFLDRLEHLEDLSKEELKDISARVRKKRYQL